MMSRPMQWNGQVEGSFRRNYIFKGKIVYLYEVGLFVLKLGCAIVTPTVV